MSKWSRARRIPHSTGSPLKWLLLLVLILGAGSFAHYISKIQSGHTPLPPIEATQRYQPELAVEAGQDSEGLIGADPGSLPFAFNVEAGQTLSEILEGHGLGAAEARQAVEEIRPYLDPRALRAGDPYSVFLAANAQPAAFQIGLEGKGLISLRRQEQLQAAWAATWRPYVQSTRPRFVRGELVTSLEEAIRQGGGRLTLPYQMADVLQWDLDFTRDLRVGDRFEVLYEEELLDGNYASLGKIHALRYENQGRLIEAYRFGEGENYYDGQGRPMRKLFLRSPLKFSRITSRFSKRRFHPVLKRYRPHYGVDYGAPTGTPVRVTANGKVISAGWNRGGGKTVKVRHPRGYVTAYLHLSRFAEDIKAGRSVSQGQVVGFVGSTGLSTGPHLDYRVQQNGKWIDPLSIKSVPAQAITTEDLPDFLEYRDELRAYLDAGRPLPPETALQTTVLAQNSHRVAPDSEMGSVQR